MGRSPADQSNNQQRSGIAPLYRRPRTIPWMAKCVVESSIVRSGFASGSNNLRRFSQVPADRAKPIIDDDHATSLWNQPDFAALVSSLYV